MPDCENKSFAHGFRQVEELGVSNLVGTPLLRGYMHGYFIDMKLYTRFVLSSRNCATVVGSPRDDFW